MATDNLSTADEIQHQMQSVRSSLRADMKELVENARDMTDWHYYVRRYPIASLAVAAAAGFALTSLGAPAPKAMSASFSTDAPLVAKPGTGGSIPAGQAPSFFQQLLGNASTMATSAVTRAAMGILSQQLRRFVDGQLRELQPSESAQQGDRHVQSHR